MSVAMKSLDELVDEGVIELTRGKIISKKDLNASPGHYPVYSSAKENEGKFGEYGKYMFDEELITWSVDGGGRLFYRPKHKFSVTNVGGVLRVLNRESLDYKYLYHALTLRHSEVIFDWVAKAHPSIIRKLYRNIPIPSFADQQRIVSILDEAFEGIAKATANAEKNLANARELFESYLQSVFESKGEGWVEKTLGDVCSLYQGIAINAKTKHALVEKSDLPLLRIKDLKNNTVEQYIDPNNYPRNALVSEDDIIYTRTGSLGLVFRGKRGVLHNNSFKVVPTEELSKDYLFIWLQNPSFKSKIMELALKAAQPDITHAIFKIQEIAVPPLKEQKAIVYKLDALSAETKRLEVIYQQKLTALDELKKSILNQAFSGQLQ